MQCVHVHAHLKRIYSSCSLSMQELQAPVVVLPATSGRSVHIWGKGDITLGGIISWSALGGVHT